MGAGGEGGEGEEPNYFLNTALLRAHLGSLPLPALPPSPHEFRMVRRRAPDLPNRAHLAPGRAFQEWGKAIFAHTQAREAGGFRQNPFGGRSAWRPHQASSNEIEGTVDSAL